MRAQGSERSDRTLDGAPRPFRDQPAGNKAAVLLSGCPAGSKPSNCLAWRGGPLRAVGSSAKQQGIEIMSSKIIYKLIEEITEKMMGLLEPEEVRTEIGGAEVLAVFGNGKRKVAGCKVLDGKLEKGCFVVVKRGKEAVFEGTMNSLRREKDNVNEVSSGTECGVGAEEFTAWEAGDSITDSARESNKAHLYTNISRVA